MRRSEAKEIAQKITNTELKQMFDNARANIKNWEAVSIVNKSFTKGVAWNILAKDFDINHNYITLSKTNMIREFGEYLPEALKPIKNKIKNKIIPVHREPEFND